MHEQAEPSNIRKSETVGSDDSPAITAGKVERDAVNESVAGDDIQCHVGGLLDGTSDAGPSDARPSDAGLSVAGGSDGPPVQYERKGKGRA